MHMYVVYDIKLEKQYCASFVFSYLSMQWLEKDFLGYLKEWEESVSKREGLTNKERNNMLLSQETCFGIEVTGKAASGDHTEGAFFVVVSYLSLCSFIELAKFAFTISGVRAFLSEKLSQDPLEQFFGCQRQRGGTSKNPTVAEFCKNTQALRVINTACVNVS